MQPFRSVQTRIFGGNVNHYLLSAPEPENPWEPWTPNSWWPDNRSFTYIEFYPAGKNPRTGCPVLWFGAGCELLPSPDPVNWPEPPLSGIEWGYMREHPTVSKLRWGWLDTEGHRHEESIFIPRHTLPIGLWGEVPIAGPDSICTTYLVDIRLSDLMFDAVNNSWSMRISAWAPLMGASYPLGKYSSDPWPAETNVLLHTAVVEGMRLKHFPRALAISTSAHRAITPIGTVSGTGGTAYTIIIEGDVPKYAGVWDGTDGGLSPWPSPFLKHWGMTGISSAWSFLTPEQAAHYCGMIGSPFHRAGPMPPLWGYQGAPYYLAYYDEPDFEPTSWAPYDPRTYEGRLANRVLWHNLSGRDVGGDYSPSNWPLGTARAVVWPESRLWGGIPMGQPVPSSVDRVSRIALYTPTPAGDTVALYTDPTGVAWNVSLEGTEIWVKHLEKDWQTWSDPVVVDATGAYDSVAITGNGRVLYVNARRSTDEVTFSFQSLDYGQTWQGPVRIGKNLT